MKPIENKEIIRIALERFFKSWGFDVPRYETDEKGNTFFMQADEQEKQFVNKKQHITFNSGMLFFC